ncbi:hypothetical protein IH992_06595 [Candidatus Poribacteria bacterium]|nr:hypothetical protein [Candidatus Poribacteria bacterium]
MKIAFSLVKTGLGNNGGSRTVLKCAEALENIGHRVYLIGAVDRFTWFTHKRLQRALPRDVDAYVATGSQSLSSVLVSHAPIKAWYIRGHEVWIMSEKDLARLYNKPQINIVNSKGLQKKLARLGVKSHVVYQGINLNDWRDLHLRGKTIRIGCLYNPRPTKKWNTFSAIAQRLGNRYEYVAFGSTRCKASFLTEYRTNPSHAELVRLYSSCHIWFAPTILEGLHNVPQEAALCGCHIICSNNEMNGMVCDYAIHGKTAQVYANTDEAINLIRNPDFSLVPKMQAYIKKHIGSREENMRRFVSILSRTDNRQ